MRSIPNSIVERMPEVAAVFAEHGFENARIEDIAAAMGVSQSTLYYYFEGKEGVLRFLLVDSLQRMGELVEEALASEGTARQRLERVVRAHLVAAASRPAAARVLLEERGRAGRSSDIDELSRATVSEPLEQLLREGAKDGSLVLDDLEIASAALFGAVASLSLLPAIDPPRSDVDRIADVFLDMLMRGIGGKKTHDARRR